MEQPGAGPAPEPADEGRHQPDADPLWNESWYFDFATPDGALGGYVRLGLCPALGASWFWACVVGEGRPLVAVLDHDVPAPAGAGLAVRSEGLWSDLICEEPLEHWTIGLEAFGVALDDPLEATRAVRGERTALGLDLEWETAGGVYGYPGVSRYEVPCRVHGEVLIGAETVAIDGWGQRDHSWGRRDWWSFEWCWTAGWLDDGTRWHASRPLIDGVRYEPGYVVPPGGELAPIGAFSVADDLGEQGLPVTSRLQVGALGLSVEPRHWAPVGLAGPDGRRGRLARALSRVTAGDGRGGVAWMEWNQPGR